MFNNTNKVIRKDYLHLITLLIELNLDPDDVAGEQVGDIAPPRHGLQHGNGEKQQAARRVSTGPMGRRHLKMYQ